VTLFTCSESRELISARIDDELDSQTATRLDSHLQSCYECSAYQDDAYALRRSFQVQAVSDDARAPEAPPAAVSAAGSLAGVSFLRWMLFAIGGTLVILNASSLLSTESGVGAHLSRHDGVFGTALGIGMLAVALKPHRAIGLVPLTSTIAVLMIIVAIGDLAAGNTKLLGEAVHVVEFLGLICLWVISGGPSRIPRLRQAVASRRPLAG